MVYFKSSSATTSNSSSSTSSSVSSSACPSSSSGASSSTSSASSVSSTTSSSTGVSVSSLAVCSCESHILRIWFAASSAEPSLTLSNLPSWVFSTESIGLFSSIQLKIVLAPFQQVCLSQALKLYVD